jgi:nitroreductase
MDHAEVVRRRRMARSFVDRPVEPAVLLRVLDAARRAPSAGHAQGLDLVVLEGAAEVSRYWEVTMADPDRRIAFRWQGLLRAPVLVVPYVRPAAWAARYAEPDKAATGLGEEGAWAVPYWWVDGGMAVQLLLLAAVDEGLGACFFGQFDHEAPVRAALGVPDGDGADGHRALGTIALGHPAASDEPGRSATRARRPLDEVVHRGHW